MSSYQAVYAKRLKMGLNTNNQQVKPQIYKWMQIVDIPYLLAKMYCIHTLKLNLHLLEMSHACRLKLN